MKKNEILELLEDERIKSDTGIKFIYYLDDNTQIKIYNKNGDVSYDLSIYADKNKYGNTYNNNIKLNNDYELERNILKRKIMTKNF